METLGAENRQYLRKLLILNIILLVSGLGVAAFTHLPASRLPVGDQPPTYNYPAPYYSSPNGDQSSTYNYPAPYYYSPNGYNYYYIPGSGSVTWGFPNPPYSYTTDTGDPWYGYLVCNSPFDCKNIIYDPNYRQLYPAVRIQTNRSFTCNNVQFVDFCWNKYNQELDAYYRSYSHLVCDPSGNCWKTKQILRPSYP